VEYVAHFCLDDMMKRGPLPQVSNNLLLRYDGAEDQFAPVVVGSDAWYMWLADSGLQSFSFRNALGSFTARRERKRHGQYWYAYRKCAGRLRKAYLGKSEDLTLERLNIVAAMLAGCSNQSNGAHAHLDDLGRTVPAVSRDVYDEKNSFSPWPASMLPFPVSTQSCKGQLPARLTPLVGREQEVATACSLLRRPEVRFLTLVGIGGVGKTRLGVEIATELAADFTGGVCFVSLGSISDHRMVLSAIAAALGLREFGEQSFIERLIACLQEKELLLFLDNFEQVIDAAPELTTLLGRCPALKILVTSREALRVHGEQELPVTPLALPDLAQLPEPEALVQYGAVALLLQYLRQVQSNFQITAANASTIAAICNRLDGLPLSLELAAARLKLLSPQALLSRLEHRLAVLTQGRRDGPPRQQTLRNTLQWSYDLLDAREQCLFRRLAVFVGGCTVEAVEAVCKTLGEETEDIFDGIASLRDKSLLQIQGAQFDGEMRLTMLETIREYGLECLASYREIEPVRQAHAQYYLELAEEAEVEHSQHARGLERLECEHGNLRAAMQWSLESSKAGGGYGERNCEMALRFARALRGFWVVYGYWSEGRVFLDRVLAASEGNETVARAKVLEVAAGLAVYQNDHERGEMLCRESLKRCRACGDTDGTAYSLYLLGTLDWQRGDFATALSLVEESLALYRETGDERSIAYSLSCVAQLLTQQGDYARAHALLEESILIYRKLGTRRELAHAQRALALTLFISQRDPALVRSLLEESTALSRELADKSNLARCLSHSALVALQRDDVDTAYLLLEESMALHKETGDLWGIIWVQSLLARVEVHRGNLEVAYDLYVEGLEEAIRINSKLNIAVCLESMANILVIWREPVRAVKLWGTAEALREVIAAPIWSVERPSYERSVAVARNLLRAAAFTAAWAEGRTMRPEQILVIEKSRKMPSTIPAGYLSLPAIKTQARFPARLTRREVEVLRLLTRGLTSAQIAAQLVISLPTVNTHVGSIYTKLGVSSRAAATRYAVEHHLV
jgi:predicted ATPase/DNA-binding CsgD family transcriptional regulator